MTAEWNVFTTFKIKGPCWGNSKVLLHEATCKEHVMTKLWSHINYLFSPRKTSPLKCHLCGASTEEYEQEVDLLASRFQCTLYNVQCISGTAAGTQTFHYIRAISNESVKWKFSYSNESRIGRVLYTSVIDHWTTAFAKIKGYVIIIIIIIIIIYLFICRAP